MSLSKEVMAKVATLIRDKFAGDYAAAFTHFDADGDAGLNLSELAAALKDAGITRALRYAAAAHALLAYDLNNDGRVTLAEFTAAFPEGG